MSKRSKFTPAIAPLRSTRSVTVVPCPETVSGERYFSLTVFSDSFALRMLICCQPPESSRS